jgi:hypothetical protein
MSAMVDLSARSGQMLLRRPSRELNLPLVGEVASEASLGGLTAIAVISMRRHHGEGRLDLATVRWRASLEARIPAFDT